MRIHIKSFLGAKKYADILLFMVIYLQRCLTPNPTRAVYSLCNKSKHSSSFNYPSEMRNPHLGVNHSVQDGTTVKAMERLKKD